MKIFFKFLFVAFTILITITKTYAASVEPIQLNAFGNIERFIIDPDSNYVVYNEFESIDVLNRFSRKIDGSSGNIPLGSNIPATSVFSNFQIDNNSRVISRVDNPSTGNRDFLSILIDGSNPTLLSAPFISPGNVSSFSLTGEGNRIAFITTSGGGLFSIPNDGSEPAIDLSSSIDPNGNVDVGRIRQTLDSNTVVFDAELDAIREEALFSVPIDGSQNPTRLSPLNDSKVDNFSVAPNIQTVVYVEEVGDDESTTFQQQIFSVAIDGSSEPIAITDSIIGQFELIDFDISPNSQYVVYKIHNANLNQSQLYSVRIDGSTPPILINEGIEFHQFEITNNNQYIIYSITKEFPRNIFIETEIPVLMRSSLTPTPSDSPVLLSANDFASFPEIQVTETTPLPINLDVRFEATSDSKFVYFIQEFAGSFLSANQVPHLLRTTIEDPSEMVQINDGSIGFPSGLGNLISSSVIDFIISRDDQTIVYKIDGPLLLIPQLVRVSTTSRNNELLPTLEFGSVNDFDISNNGDFIVFTTNSGIDDLQNLYSINISEPEPLCFPIKAQNDNFVTICL